MENKTNNPQKNISLNNAFDADGKISESKVNHLVDLYMENAKAGKEAGKNDPFWYKTEKEFMLAVNNPDLKKLEL